MVSDEREGHEAQPDEPQNISGFVARVLNQLSLSAWLPGAFLVSGVALIVQFQVQDALTFENAAEVIEENWLPLLVLALPTLVVSTLLTQAFSFEAIRALEGYWRRPGPPTWIRSALTRWQSWQMRRLRQRLEKLTLMTFKRTQPALIAAGTDARVLIAVEAELLGVEPPSGLTKKLRREVAELEWWNLSSPWDTARLLDTVRELEGYPAHARLMPTKLGNVIRATEDELVNTGGDVEGFVLRNRMHAPPRLQLHHDQFRMRLDMYCTLVFVSGVLALAALIALRDLQRWEVAVATLAFAAVSWVSYGAAISSARGYCKALRVLDEVVGTAQTNAASHASS